MGLIKAGIGALGGTLADQWKEFFYCEAMPKEVLVTKGQKRITSRSSNTKGKAGAVRSLLGKGLAMSLFPKTGDRRITGFRKDIPGRGRHRCPPRGHRG